MMPLVLWLTFTAPSNISSDTQMIFELIVRDSKNVSSTDDVIVTDKYVSPPNRLPTANVGPYYTVNANENVTLNGMYKLRSRW